MATRLFTPSSVAVIGASADRNKVGGRPIHYMGRFGYGGRVYPVNPGRREVQGLRCYPDVAALPEVPDMAVVALSAADAAAAVDDCARRGVGTVVIMSSGFGETGAAGRQAERNMVRVARRHGTRLIGPNCQGLANFATGAVANFSTMFGEVPPADGPVAILSQSGAASVMAYALLREQGIGVRYLAASGNDADVTVAELIAAVVADEAVHVVLLYLEAVADAPALAAAAEAARARGVMLVAVKAGTSGKGAAAAASHTGALATEDGVVGAFFHRHGIWRVRTIQELVNAVPLTLSGRHPGAGRVLVMSHSGAVGVLCADVAERLSLPVPDLAPSTRDRLAALLPSFGAVQNPVDLTAGLMTDSGLFARALGVLAGDPGIDAVHIGVPVAGVGYDVDGFAAAAAAVGVAQGKPVTVAGPQRNVLAVFANQGLPTYRDDAAALAALAQCVAHHRLLGERVPEVPTRPRLQLPAGAGQMLDEAQSLALLGHAGIPSVAHAVCATAAQARRAFADLAGRCVVKACSTEAPHKSEHGLVWLGVGTVEALDAAYAACRDRMAALGMAGTVVVARMEAGLREVAVGARRDPVFGPVVLVGDGGKYVEVLGDFQLLTPPFTAAEAVAALRTLRIWPILQGVRGEPPADVDALGAVAAALGDLMLVNPGIDAVDLNPVMVRRAGEGAVVVDALVTRVADALRGAA